MTPDRPELSRDEVALCAHDLRGALTVIAGYAALLRRDDISPADRVSALDGIEAAIARADALVGDTLAGRIVPRKLDGLVDLSVLAERAAADARVAFGRRIDVNEEGSPRAHGDAIALARVLENLLSNAAKYAPDGPIEVAVRREGDLAVIEVADRGPGIPAEHRSTVLEPFARLPRDDELPGTGLGLAVVGGVAERLGGRVEVLGREGGGTVVRVEVPAAR